MKKITVVTICLLLAIPATVSAKAKDVRTETRKCNAAFSLCETVAADDQRTCNRVTPNSDCAGDYARDINQCGSDKTSCINSISAPRQRPDVMVPRSTQTRQ